MDVGSIIRHHVTSPTKIIIVKKLIKGKKRGRGEERKVGDGVCRSFDISDEKYR